RSRGRRARSAHRRARRSPRRSQRVQASSGGARCAGVAEGVRQGPPAADHEPLARVGIVRDRRFAAEGALVFAALLFGTTFPLVHDALDQVTPMAYLVLRFTVAVVALGPFAIV